MFDHKADNYFLLGELFAGMPLPVDPAMDSEHCRHCPTYPDICLTAAFAGPYRLDARRCISYLTAEYEDAIPLELRPLISSRVLDCDDCQIVHPWNRSARPTRQGDFQPRHNLDSVELAELFLWNEGEFLGRIEGPPLCRAGYER